MRSQPSPGSEDLTKGCAEPDGSMSPSANPTPTDETCSENASPECPSTKTYAKLRRAGEDDPSPESWAETDVAPTVDAAGHGPRTATLVLAWNWQEDDYDPKLTSPPLATDGQQEIAVLTSSAGASPAKTSLLPAAAQGSQESDPASFSNSPELPRLFDPVGYSSRTYQVFSLATAVGTSESCLERWPTSGMAWRGGFSTHVTSECRSDEDGCSSSEPSLTEILEPPQSVAEKYSLSARAAQGILRRAEKRGRKLPEMLFRALSEVAGDSAGTISTGGGVHH